MDLESLFKKFVYTGVGFVSLTTDRFQKTVEGLVGDGKISEDEGEKIFDEFLKNTDTKKDELENQFGSVVEKLVKSFSFATSSDLDSLKNRVAVLEAAVAKKEEAEKKANTTE